MSVYHGNGLAVFPDGAVDSTVIEFRVQKRIESSEVVDRQSVTGGVSLEHGVADI